MTSPARKHRLLEIAWPDFGTADVPSFAPLSELQTRMENLRSKMKERRLTHAVVYGDREHYANIAYLTGFDPRFEETLLIVKETGAPLILVGNECEAYLGISALKQAGELRHERFQSFSLLGQPRDRSRLIRSILESEAISAGSRVGVVGYKYFSETEAEDAAHCLDIPAYIADSLRGLAGNENVVNVTEFLMHPGSGLRANCTPFEIALFEYANCQAADAAKQMIFGLREGLTDLAVVKAAGLTGEPLSCHITFGTGAKAQYGLCGPTGEKIKRGQPLAFNVAYWGSNICRAGWIADSADDLPAEAADYVASFAGPCFEALAGWFSLMKIGTPGHVVFDYIQDKLPFDKFGVYLNPGHLIHLDEWMSSPFYKGSDIPIASGMAIQVDVIPASSTYFSTRMEDGIVIADERLRSRLQELAPACYDRCRQRRSFMTGVLGIELPEEVLPLSNTCAIVPPFFLKPNTVLALAS